MPQSPFKSLVSFDFSFLTVQGNNSRSYNEDENKVLEPTNTDFNSIHLIREKINLVYGEKGRKMASWFSDIYLFI